MICLENNYQIEYQRQKQYIYMDRKKDIKLLDEIKRDIFHSVASKLLFITKHVRPYFDPTVVYLYTQVTRSDDDDWRKLRHMLNYMKKRDCHATRGYGGR